MATHSSILTWKIPWTEEPGGLLSIGLQRVGYDWSDLTHEIHLYCTKLISYFVCSSFSHLVHIFLWSHLYVTPVKISLPLILVLCLLTDVSPSFRFHVPASEGMSSNFWLRIEDHEFDIATCLAFIVLKGAGFYSGGQLSHLLFHLILLRIV